MRLINADELKTAFPCGEYIMTESVRATIDHMPTIEPERKKGEWDDIGGIIRWGCPVCHHAYETKYNFCPNCGDRKR